MLVAGIELCNQICIPGCTLYRKYIIGLPSFLTSYCYIALITQYSLIVVKKYDS